MKEQEITVFMAWDARLDLPVKVSLVQFLPFLCHAMLGRENPSLSRGCVTNRRQRVGTGLTYARLRQV